MGHPNKKSEKEEETSSITSELSVDSALMAELDHMLCQPSEESSDQSGVEDDEFEVRMKSLRQNRQRGLAKKMKE